jgi:hypothetical protein
MRTKTGKDGKAGKNFRARPRPEVAIFSGNDASRLAACEMRSHDLFSPEANFAEQNKDL